jgi:hypothetical protein
MKFNQGHRTTPKQSYSWINQEIFKTTVFLECNSTVCVFRPIWKDIHSWVFQRCQIALVIWLVNDFDRLWKTHLRIVFPNCTPNHSITTPQKTSAHARVLEKMARNLNTKLETKTRLFNYLRQLKQTKQCT